MGVWGAGVFDSDTAAGVRSDWCDGVLDGVDLLTLTARIVHALLQADEDDIFWPALAAAQHQTGRLDDAVRERAVAVIDAGVDEDKWEGSVAARRRALARLREQLTGPRVAPKRIRRARSYGVPLELGDVVALRNGEGRFGALVAVAGLQRARHPGDAADPLVVNLVWDGVDPIPGVDLAALDVVWAGRNGRGERLARCTSVLTPRRADVLTDAIGAIVGRAVHPYRLPANYERVAGIPLVQHCDSWPNMYEVARRAGTEGNAPITVHEELLGVQRRAGEAAREHGVDALLPDAQPDIFADSGETYYMLRAMLHRHPRVGGGLLLGLDEPQWRWTVNRFTPIDAQELETLRMRNAALNARAHCLGRH